MKSFSFKFIVPEQPVPIEKVPEAFYGCDEDPIAKEEGNLLIGFMFYVNQPSTKNTMRKYDIFYFDKDGKEQRKSNY